MLALDLSSSMSAKDLDDEKTRLDIAKKVLKDFIAKRKKDRLGLILFADAAYLQSPLTSDHALLEMVLSESEVGMAGMSTHIGDAIGLSVKLLKDSRAEDKLLILLTDGNDTASRVPPIEAAKLAKKYGVKIYSLAVGDPSTLGEDSLDIRTLTEISKLTAGGYFRANSELDLKKAYDDINKLEASKLRVSRFIPKRDVFYIPVLFIILLNLILYYSLYLHTRWERHHV